MTIDLFLENKKSHINNLKQEGGSMENLKKGKTEEHSRSPQSEPYALLYRSKLNCFLVFMHMCIEVNYVVFGFYAHVRYAHY